MQKQPFVGILQNRSSELFYKAHREIAVPESLFNKAVDLQSANFIKSDTPVQVFSCKFYETFMNIFMNFLQNTYGWLILSMFKIM